MVSRVWPDRASAGKLAALAKAAFPDRRTTWSAGEIGALSGQPGVAIFADSALAAGFVILRCAADEGEILDLGVIPSARRRGLGRDLLASAGRHAAREGATGLFLEVAEDNTAARALYAQAGFGEAGRRKGYYPRPDGARVDALVLQRPLVSGTASVPGVAVSPPPRGKG